MSEERTRLLQGPARSPRRSRPSRTMQQRRAGAAPVDRGVELATTSMRTTSGASIRSS